MAESDRRCCQAASLGRRWTSTAARAWLGTPALWDGAAAGSAMPGCAEAGSTTTGLWKTSGLATWTSTATGQGARCATGGSGCPGGATGSGSSCGAAAGAIACCGCSCGCMSTVGDGMRARGSIAEDSCPLRSAAPSAIATAAPALHTGLPLSRSRPCATASLACLSAARRRLQPHLRQAGFGQRCDQVHIPPAQRTAPPRAGYVAHLSCHAHDLTCCR